MGLVGWVRQDGFGRLGWVWLTLVNMALNCSRTESKVPGGVVVLVGGGAN